MTSLPNFGEVRNAISSMCTAMQQATLFGVGIFFIAFLVFAAASYFAYRKYQTGKNKLMLAVAAFCVLLSIGSIMLSVNNLLNYMSIGEC
jgi:hypothetical protein